MDQTSATISEPKLTITAGVCRVMFAFDIGHSIDLNSVEATTTTLAGREVERVGMRTSQSSRRLPRDFAQQPPLRISVPSQPISLGAWETATSVETVLFDFGAASVAYTIPMRSEFERLRELAALLYDSADLREDARRRVAGMLTHLGESVVRSHITDAVEDYIVFEIERFEVSDGTLQQWRERNAALLASVLRAESGSLSEQEIVDATSRCLSYSPDDFTLVDWNAAVIFDPHAPETSSVLEFANVELLEMRHLDNLLDRSLDRAYRAAERRSRIAWIDAKRAGADMHEISRLQIEHAALFEGVNNALKLVGDQYLARVYHAATSRFHLPEWDTSILRKLGTLESIYSKLSDRASVKRAEGLEIVIIWLIAFEIVMSLLRLK